MSNDKDRMYRHPELTVAELEKLVQLVSASKTVMFRHGDKEEVARLQALQDKLKKSIIKE